MALALFERLRPPSRPRPDDPDGATCPLRVKHHYKLCFSNVSSVGMSSHTTIVPARVPMNRPILFLNKFCQVKDRERLDNLHFERLHGNELKPSIGAILLVLFNLSFGNLTQPFSSAEQTISHHVPHRVTWPTRAVATRPCVVRRPCVLSPLLLCISPPVLFDDISDDNDLFCLNISMWTHQSQCPIAV
jgi:hypothetical protein